MKTTILRIVLYALPLSIIVGIDGNHAHSLAMMSSQFWYTFPFLVLFYAITTYFKLSKTRFPKVLVSRGHQLVIATDIILAIALAVHRFAPSSFPVLDLTIELLLIVHGHHIVNCLLEMYKRYHSDKQP